jgi:DNA-binding winged helix-turn-helix (wHTH) protein
MTADRFQFEPFTLDCANRRLLRHGVPVDLNARYFDALALLVREKGTLVSKDRFLEEVWRGVPVTDEALTQCIRVLRRQLGDSATRPRFIETAPKHGYRFIAPVQRKVAAPAASPVRHHPWMDVVQLGAAGTLGGAFAGLVGGLIYGLVAASQPVAQGTGAMSMVLVMMFVTMLVALVGGAGVSFGLAAGEYAPARRREWMILGAAAGGMFIGAFVKMLSGDAFRLLLGSAPADMTGASEGALLGMAIGLGYWIASKIALRRALAATAILCGLAGSIVPLIGGRLLGGSLASLGESFPRSLLHMERLGALFGEADFGLRTQIVTGALEGALFGSCVVCAIVLGRRIQARSNEPAGPQQDADGGASGKDRQYAQPKA